MIELSEEDARRIIRHSLEAWREYRKFWAGIEWTVHREFLKPHEREQVTIDAIKAISK